MNGSISGPSVANFPESDPLNQEPVEEIKEQPEEEDQYFDQSHEISKVIDNDDIVAPSKGVAKQQEIEKKKQEIKLKIRDAMIEKQREEEEKGNEHVTNLPLELLFK